MKEQEFLVASDRFFLDFTTDEGLEAKGFNVSLQSVEIPRGESFLAEEGK